MIKLLMSATLALGVLVSNDAFAAQQTITLTVENMYCEACPYMVKKTLEHVAGVAKVTVVFKEKTATVVYDDAKTNVKALTDAATSAGFPSTPKS
jgi:mercuric ion binding protein